METSTYGRGFFLTDFVKKITKSAAVEPRKQNRSDCADSRDAHRDYRTF